MNKTSTRYFFRHLTRPFCFPFNTQRPTRIQQKNGRSRAPSAETSAENVDTFIYNGSHIIYSHSPSLRLAYILFLKYIQSGGALLNQYYLYRSPSTFTSRMPARISSFHLNLTDRHNYVMYCQSISMRHSII